MSNYQQRKLDTESGYTENRRGGGKYAIIKPMNALTKNTMINIRNASKVLGITAKDVLERASLFYLDAIKKELEFKKELDFWDYLRDETLAKSGPMKLN